VVQGLGLPGYTPIQSLVHKLRCENCGERGKVLLSVDHLGELMG
jgi:hypothetical protein